MTEQALGMIIACGILEHDLESIRKPTWPVHYIEQDLHLAPRKLHRRIQERVDSETDPAGPVLLLYGLCGVGADGLKAGKAELIMPRFHDCMPFFLGSRSRYELIFRSNPCTFFLPSCWVAARLDPLSIVEEHYTPRVGRQAAEWCMSMELKHYRRFLFIDSGTSDSQILLKRVHDNAIFFDKECEQIRGTRDSLARALVGPRNNKEFIKLHSGEQIVRQMFQ